MKNEKLTTAQELSVVSDVIEYLEGRGVEGPLAACILKTAATHIENQVAKKCFLVSMSKALNK
ncbi:hypothetical protein LY624_15030 [Pseudoalteromonas sp. N1230-9]|uniref:hypothetical protein n=1 Tax=Pseudoalteromonas sp. N1230-9 TaxID=2907156 RepID=UPI002B2C6658|nr:hypothetical protein LY624_15030 [Pseudoalteromonas sp. N1230-9]